MLAVFGVTASACDDVLVWPLSPCDDVIDVYIWNSASH